jgi:co-chaperonin GroES (HSP10)
MKAIGNKLIVKVQKEESTKKTASGLTLPTGINNPGIEKAEVIAVGGEVTEISVGQVLFIHKGYGSEFTNPTDNEKYRSMDLNGVIVILD